jgi:hypothetical protein
MQELEKVKATELKKNERTNRKEIQEFESLFEQCGSSEKNLQLMQERGMKTLTDLCRKAAKKYQQSAAPTQHVLQQVDEIKAELSKHVKMRKTLQMMSENFLKKNSDLYLQHEMMLDEERKMRQDLGAEFQTKMAVIHEELNSEKELRSKQMEENNAIRAKIQTAISEYNVKEQDYQSKMKGYQGQMAELETKFKGQIEGKIQTQLAVAKDAKDKYDGSVASVEHLASQIKAIVEKFDTIKDEISNSSEKMNGYKDTVE